MGVQNGLNECANEVDNKVCRWVKIRIAKFKFIARWLF